MNTQPLTASTPEITKVMIVDDDIDILDSLRDVLELESKYYEIQTASNIKAARAISRKYHPDIALLDIKIGKDIGLDLVPNLKQETPYTKCIMMTAFRESEYAVEAVRKGADDYLFKPLDPKNLLKVINQYSNAIRLEKSSLISRMRFQVMFEQSFQITYILSPEGEILNVNSIAQSFSQQERESLVGQPLWNTPPFSYHHHNSDMVKELIQEIKPAGFIENGMSLLRDNDKTLFIDFAAKPIVNSGGQFDSIIVELKDNSEIYYANKIIKALNSNLETTVINRTRKLKQSLTLLENENLQRKQAEAELLEAKEITEQASKARSVFLSRVSHELRTPMNAILGLTQVLKLEQLTETQEGYIDEIHSASDHLMDLISEILDLSHIESGKLEVKLEEVSLQEVLIFCRKLIRPLAEQRNISLHKFITEGANYHLTTDPKRLKQILLNLLSNAIKYNIDGGSVSIELAPAEDNQLRISVKDSGIGIASALHYRIFNTFDMLGQEYELTGSSGLGLAITKKLVESLNGSISFDSEIGQGSTFHVLLPLSKGSSD